MPRRKDHNRPHHTAAYHRDRRFRRKLCLIWCRRDSCRRAKRCRNTHRNFPAMMANREMSRYLAFVQVVRQRALRMGVKNRDDQLDFLPVEMGGLACIRDYPLDAYPTREAQNLWEAHICTPQCATPVPILLANK